ncbi:peptidoglycan recognition protein family protein [Clostridium sp. DL1XJH146]
MIDLNIIDTHLKFNGNFSRGNKPKFMVLHHADISRCSIQDIHSWHQAKGWAGCGYHYFITKGGDIYRGRTDDMIGSHCKGHNTNSIGICCEGDYVEETMPDKQQEALCELCCSLMDKYNIKTIYGHKELRATSCPGNKFPLDIIKNKVTLKKTSGGSKPYCGYLLRINSNHYDENVRLVQKRLVEFGYDIGICGVDGYFGDDTYLAVLHYQQDHGLKVDGIVGPETWKILF